MKVKRRRYNKYRQFHAEVVADSVSPDGIRLTTFEITFPTFVLAEFNTHRVFSRNTASARAIPVKRMIEAVLKNPFIPEKMPKNKAGMSNTEWLSGFKETLARFGWRTAAVTSCYFAKIFDLLGVHKQIANRLLAPFSWTTSLVTSTEWDNFFRLRTANDAQPEIRKLAVMMHDAYVKNAGKVRQLKPGEWHLPYISETEVSEITRFALSGALENLIHFDHLKDGEIRLHDFTTAALQLASAGRCARISYLNHGAANPVDKDIMLAERLISSRHLSPTEHVATPSGDKEFHGNFRGWLQYRKSIRDESGDHPFKK